MPTEPGPRRLVSLVAASGIVVVVLFAGKIHLSDGWDKAAHFAAFSALTFCLWHATAGAMPFLVLGGVILLGALDEYRQAFEPERMSDAKDFLVDLCAALATAALLYMQRKRVCAESLPR